MTRFVVFVGCLLAMFSIVSGQDSSGQPNLHLIVERESFTVYVASTEPVSLSGLSFRVVNSLGTFESFSFVDGFNILKLTDGIARPGSCFIYTLADATPPLPSSCSQQSLVFRLEVPRVDVFWYDFTANRQRDIAVMSNDEITGDICPATVVNCPLFYIATEVIATATPNPNDDDTLSVVSPQYPDNLATINSEWTPIVEEINAVEMVLAPPGCFMMGSSDEELDYGLGLCEASAGAAACRNIAFDAETPQSQVCFDYSFWIDRYEVTNAAYGSSGNFPNLERPRENVDWYEANDFCEARGARLPSEAEWEYAARGPDSLIFPWGNEFLFRNVVYKKNSANQTANVTRNGDGASWLGAHHMSGNLWEWTKTLFREYPYDAQDGREGGGQGVYVIRGGSWGDGDSIVRAAYRGKAAPEYHDEYTGFRCARDFDPNDIGT